MSSQSAGHATPGLPTSFVTRLLPPSGDRPLHEDTHQGVLPWEEEVAPPTAAPAIRVVPSDPGAWASRFAQAVVEVVAGHRHVAQLLSWATPTVFRDLERRAQLAARSTPTRRGIPNQRSAMRPQVGSVHVCRLGPDVAEVSVRVRHGRRSRALALRLEATEGRWRCTAIEFG